MWAYGWTFPKVSGGTRSPGQAPEDVLAAGRTGLGEITEKLAENGLALAGEPASAGLVEVDRGENRVR